MADILILGGGVSGLSAGIYGLLSGHSVTVCEKNTFPGGNLTGWYRGEYYIDNCIHWLTGTNPKTKTYGMWKTLGILGSVGIHRPKSLYTCECCGITLSLHRDLGRLKKEMLALSPADEKEINGLIKAIDAVRRIEAGTASRRGALSLYKYYSLTTGELADRFKHPLIKKFLSSFLTEDFGAAALVWVMAEFCSGNADCPLGGSLEAAKRMARRFKELGGRLLLNKEAVKINVSNGAVSSVTFKDNDRISADYYVSALDPYYLFGSLITLPLPGDFEKLSKDGRYSRFSSCHAAFSTDAETVPFSYEAVIDVPAVYQSALGSKYLSLREFSFEPSFAPDGRTVIQSAAFFGETRSREFTALKDDEDEYRRRKESVAHCMIRSIEYAYPKLKNKLDLLDVWTPATYNSYFNATCGSYMSYAFSSKTVPAALNNRVKGADNLFLATQWLKVPGGLPNAAEAGKNAIDAINSASGSVRRRVAAAKRAEAAAAKEFR